MAEQLVTLANQLAKEHNQKTVTLLKDALKMAENALECERVMKKAKKVLVQWETENDQCVVSQVIFENTPYMIVQGNNKEQKEYFTLRDEKVEFLGYKTDAYGQYECTKEVATRVKALVLKINPIED